MRAQNGRRPGGIGASRLRIGDCGRQDFGFRIADFGCWDSRSGSDRMNRMDGRHGLRIGDMGPCHHFGSIISNLCPFVNEMLGWGVATFRWREKRERGDFSQRREDAKHERKSDRGGAWRVGERSGREPRGTRGRKGAKTQRIWERIEGEENG